jgi:hypothetical protein
MQEEHENSLQHHFQPLLEEMLAWHFPQTIASVPSTYLPPLWHVRAAFWKALAKASCSKIDQRMNFLAQI